MQIRNLEKFLMENDLLITPAAENLEIRSIVYDSRLAADGCLFICKGANFKLDYLMSAMSNGAVCYLSEVVYDIPISCIVVSDIRKAMALTAAFFYDFPYEKLDLLGITGTKGKTTTSYIARSILAAGGLSYGLLSSVMTDTGVRCEEAHLTTPESLDLQQMLSEMVVSGFKGGIMEVSSQGLQYNRVFGIKYAAAAFLNIGQDHISPIEHKDFNEYFSAKKKMFKYTNNAVINGDDEYSAEIIRAARENGCTVTTFGFGESNDIWAYDVSRKGKYTVFNVKTDKFNRKFYLPLLGAFNIYNALAAIGLCMNRVSFEDIQKGIKQVKVPGRMEVICDHNLTVIVDYAHNKMSFETLFASLRKEYPGKRIISVYGCPGGKAYLRRKDLGEITGRLADYTVLTAEDPNYEDVGEINNEIARYIVDCGGEYESILDRETAIEKTILNASDGDIIVITGKGEETFQKVNGEYVDFTGDIPLSKKNLEKRRKLKKGN